RLSTLRAVLEAQGLAEAASRLGVHRNTIAYRVGRIEALGDWDLHDADLRLALLLAVKLVQKDETAGLGRH
ncbi:MAG TPA: helix-turn-helix domain-containing protein, partial [Candidatus Limnocylindrales bacterium]